MSQKTHAARLKKIAQRRGRTPLLAGARITVDDKGKRIMQLYGPKQLIEQRPTLINGYREPKEGA